MTELYVDSESLKFWKKNTTYSGVSISERQSLEIFYLDIHETCPNIVPLLIPDGSVKISAIW